MQKQLQEQLSEVSEKNDVQSLQAELDKLNEEMSKVVETHKEAIREKFHAAFDTVFSQYPQVKKIVWSQGTPGFCDGDPCYFSVDEPTIQIGDKIYGEYEHSDEFEIDGREMEYEDMIYPRCYSDEEIEKHSYLSESDKCEEEKERDVLIYHAVANLIGSFEDLFEDMFNGNALVVITPEGISHDYYDVGY